MGIIISAFPGMGKIYARINSNKYNIIDINVKDFKYSVIKEKEKIGKNKFNVRTKYVENGDFPNNYIEAVKKAAESDEIDFAYVSCHSEMRELFAKNKINYILVTPKRIIKKLMLTQYKSRGNCEKFINGMDINWDKYMNSIMNETFPYQIKFDIDDSCNEEFLDCIKNNYELMIEKTQQEAVRSNMDQNMTRMSVFWPNLCRTKKNWTARDIRLYQKWIDWDTMCKFNVLPDEIIKDPSFRKYINFEYLKDNIKKYNIKIRKLIK